MTFQDQVSTTLCLALPGDNLSQANPQLKIEWSDDGGYTWSEPRYVSVGAAGSYSQLVRVWRLGQGRNRVYRVTYTENTPFALYGASLDLKIPGGTS